VPKSLCVGPDMTTAPRTTLCPSCGASVRVDAPWCSLCHADLRPAPEPSPVQPEVVVDPLTAPLLDLVLPRVEVPVLEPEVPVAAPAPEAYWPCARCESPNAITANMCGTCGYGFLGAPDRISLVLPVVGDVTKLSRAQRFGVAAAVVAVFVIPLALVTLLMTGAPPKSTPPAQQGTISTAP
jgi:hypothetical protein